MQLLTQTGAALNVSSLLFYLMFCIKINQTYAVGKWEVLLYFVCLNIEPVIGINCP